MTEKTEQQLIAEYLKGDEKSLEFLIHKYLRPVYNFVYNFVGNDADAEDIVQDVFVKVWKNIKKFNEKKSFKTWIFTIAKNTSLDFLKKKKAVPFSRFEDKNGDNGFLENIEDDELLPDKLLEREDIGGILTKAIETLSANYKTVLLLHYKEELTFQEIATILAESINTVKSRHRRALATLKGLLPSDELS